MTSSYMNTAYSGNFIQTVIPLMGHGQLTHRSVDGLEQHHRPVLVHGGELS
jgi:hypothetical protein